MDTHDQSTPTADLKRIIAAAARLGVEMDEADAVQWLTALAATHADDPVTMDTASGVYGHCIAMLDFDPADLEHFRRIGRLVEFGDQPGIVETALALSGSSAQSKIQTYPGDCDFFERVNIKAPTRAEACRILANMMRNKALSTLRGTTYRLIEVKFGNYPDDVVRDGRSVKRGAPIAWLPAEIEAGYLQATRADGTPVTITWDQVAHDPGWCKLDWIVADPVRRQVANASNMLDVTWEAPDGSIIPLDGYLDPYFQEVYLEAASIPVFSKLVRHMSPDALASYVAQLEKEVRKYLAQEINYDKAAKRMYNIFRLTGRYQDAAFLRELFDEPATLLYQVWSLIRTVDEADEPGSGLAIETVLAQADQLILAVVEVLEGEKESEIVRYLLRLRNSLAAREERGRRNAETEAARAEVINLVNNFFYEKLNAIPSIRAYMHQVQSGASPA